MSTQFYNYGNSQNTAYPDTSETIHITSLSLLKMLKHGRAGIPLEVMGLMLGEFIDEYNIKIIDVFAMPQTGTEVSVEAVDPVFQTTMLSILEITGRHETVVGWYHSHPGFGCWLSSTDVSTQSMFERLCKRSVAVVIDPIQSVKGKVVIDAFRTINTMSLDPEPRVITSNIGFLKKPSFISLVHGLNKSYYSFNISIETDMYDKKMLRYMNKRGWENNLKYTTPAIEKKNASSIEESLLLYTDMLKNEKRMDETTAGKNDHRRRLKETSNALIEKGIIDNLLLSIHRFIFN